MPSSGRDSGPGRWSECISGDPKEPQVHVAPVSPPRCSGMCRPPARPGRPHQNHPQQLTAGEGRMIELDKPLPTTASEIVTAPVSGSGPRCSGTGRCPAYPGHTSTLRLSPAGRWHRSGLSPPPPLVRWIGSPRGDAAGSGAGQVKAVVTVVGSGFPTVAPRMSSTASCKRSLPKSSAGWAKTARCRRGSRAHRHHRKGTIQFAGREVEKVGAAGYPGDKAVGQVGRGELP